MELLLIVQGLLNLAVFAALLFWWRDRRALSHTLSESRLAESLRVLEIRTKQADTELVHYRTRMEELVRTMNSLCERAKFILSRSAKARESQELTMEELELRSPNENTSSIVAAKPPAAVFTSEISLDLRSVLRDQLA